MEIDALFNDDMDIQLGNNAPKIGKLFPPSIGASQDEGSSGEKNETVTTLAKKHVVDDPLEAAYPDALEPDIQNILCSFQLRTEIDLKQTTFRLRNAEYNPRKINAVVLRLRRPKVTALIYQGGKVSISGAQTMDDAVMAAKKSAKTMQKIGYRDAVFSNFKIENIIARADVAFPIRLEQLAYDHKACASYEPELFAGCVYRMEEPKCCFLVFVTGKMVINGTTNMGELMCALRSIYPILHRYQS